MIIVSKWIHFLFSYKSWIYGLIIKSHFRFIDLLLWQAVSAQLTTWARTQRWSRKYIRLRNKMHRYSFIYSLGNQPIYLPMRWNYSSGHFWLACHNTFLALLLNIYWCILLMGYLHLLSLNDSFYFVLSTICILSLWHNQFDIISPC